MHAKRNIIQRGLFADLELPDVVSLLEGPESDSVAEAFLSLAVIRHVVMFFCPGVKHVERNGNRENHLQPAVHFIVANLYMLRVPTFPT